ncbi:MAG TPA: chemotaxis response regulator protein-glutamate methylesterase [Bacteroidetes bacterium]|nr:chemotaxis response regulator protein-glutamate methylesterase [Bacteroidota bacterium]
MNTTIKVVVVDDSAFMRKSLSLMLESDPQIKVVATARDGKEGIEKIREFKPDVVTLDVEMPVMDGLTALSVIMKEMPLPVLMVSSITTDGAKATIDALNLGAVDFIPKELSYVSVNITKIKDDLITKIKQIVQSSSLQFRMQRIRASQSRIQKSGSDPGPSARRTSIRPRSDLRAVVIGISTGGPFALLQIIPKLPASFPLGVAIVQHMPPKFTKSLAERLNGLSEVEVREASEGDRMQPGVVLIAPGGRHLTFHHSGGSVHVKTPLEPANTLYRPCADIMMNSAVQAFQGPLLGVIMTGMGKDGLEGLKAIKKRSGYVIAQDEETCVVYGMPKAAVDEGVVDTVLPLEEIPNALVAVTKEDGHG